jgi:hypothetical protein
LNNTLNSFNSVSLSEISSVSLLNRVDTKFLMPKDQLVDFLENLKNHYFIVEIDKLRTLPYNTLYFDTEDLYYYHEHHRGKLNRLKFRNREYVNSGTVFNEIKKKSNRGKTKKSRIKRADFNLNFDEEFKSFAEKKFSDSNLELLPSLEVKYNRITLVDKDFSERMTIDVGLNFSFENEKSSFEKLVVIELKRDKNGGSSAGQKLLKEFRCKQTGFSKYCIGVATTHKNIKQNNFKQKLRMVDRICGIRSC